MLKLGIVEKDNFKLKEIEKKYNFQDICKEQYLIFKYKSIEDARKEIKIGKFNCNLLLMDIHIIDSEMLELISDLYNKRMNTNIVFINIDTGCIIDNNYDRYFGYILKPYSMGNLSEEIIKKSNERENKKDSLNININGNNVKVLLKNIFYMESNKRKIILHTKQGEIAFYEKLNTMEEILEKKGFIRCHQSYMVNEGYIEKISCSSIMVDGIKIPVSRKYCEKIKKYLLKRGIN